MLERSDTDIKPVLELFSGYGVEIAFLVPTEVGMDKSIMDATSPVRRYLKSKGIHDYDSQNQGPTNKVVEEAIFIEETELIETQVSLYRPQTKQGDPRIWFYSLSKYAKPYNLLTILIFSRKIYILNASRRDILRTHNIKGSPLNDLIINLSQTHSDASSELMSLLRAISAKGFIKSNYTGDTAVGITLNEELGITKYDMSRGPDYKGIEIKSHRRNRKSRTRTTLFSQVPNWSISKLKSGSEILENYGYINSDSGRLQLYVTVRAHTPNPQGLFFDLDTENDYLVNYSERVNLQSNEEVATWELEKLRGRLLEKHPETFFVGADFKVVNGQESFHYTNVEYTKKPLVQNMDYLFDQGYLTMDYTLSQKPSGASRDHGYLFKMFKEDFHLLLPRVEKFDLTQ